MDEVDRRIIGLLHEDGRMSATAIADRLPLSLSATSERLRRLQDTGVVTGFGVRVDAATVGRTIEAVVDVRLERGQPSAPFESALRDLPMVTEAIHLTGRFDAQLRVAARDVAELDGLLHTLSNELHVEETNTRLVLRSIEGFPRPPAL